MSDEVAIMCAVEELKSLNKNIHEQNEILKELRQSINYWGSELKHLTEAHYEN